MPTWTGEPTPPARSSRWWVLPVIAVVISVIAGAVWWNQRARSVTGDAPTTMGALATDTAARAPSATRVRVRVVNTTGTRGLARRAMLVLRDFGYDVVDFDSDGRTPLAATAIEVHTGHADWGTRVQRVLGTGVVSARPDSLRYVDLTIRIGRDWQAPTEPLRP